METEVVTLYYVSARIALISHGSRSVILYQGVLHNRMAT